MKSQLKLATRERVLADPGSANIAVLLVDLKFDVLASLLDPQSEIQAYPGATDWISTRHRWSRGDCDLPEKPAPMQTTLMGLLYRITRLLDISASSNSCMFAVTDGFERLF